MHQNSYFSTILDLGVDTERAREREGGGGEGDKRN